MNNKIELGYACIVQTNDKYEKEMYQVNRTITVKKAKTLSKELLYERCRLLTRQNIDGLYNVMLYNIKNNIHMYRISSNMIVLDNHELNTYDWREDKCILNILSKIKVITTENNIRLSCHPDQFVVINSEKQEVINNSIAILKSHNNLCELLGIDTIILHVGGKVGGIDKATERFIDGFNQLPKIIQNKIVLENDNRCFNVENTLKICKELNIRMCPDFAHDKWLSSSNPIEHYIDEIIKTWKNKKPKCHLSTQSDDETNKHKHHNYINVKDFEKCLSITKGRFDIMLECKQKQIALLKLINKNEGDFDYKNK